jgi:hypothetical protein
MNTLSISEKSNPNYLAKVVKIDNLRKHSNADRLQVTTIDGNNVITSLNAKEGNIYIYFPLESSINKDYLSWSNSYEDKTLNRNNELKGFFNKHGRVRAIRLRSEKSEGYIVPGSDISNWIKEVTGKDYSFSEEDSNKEFDTIFDILICQKYINVEALRKLNSAESKQKNNKKKSRDSKLIEGQFHFHIDTSPLRKYSENISPNDLIQITRKLHGTSFVVSKVLCKKKLTWYEKVLKKIGLNIQDSHYDLVYSSRKVVKNSFIDDGSKNHFYGYDLWEDIAKSLEHSLTEGISLYGEAVGYTKTGAYIQNEYDYRCSPGEFDTYVYRITYTNASGKVFEFSSQQVKEYCSRYGIKTVPELYYGFAKDLFNDIDIDEYWSNLFVQRLSEVYLEKDCVLCNNSVPDEGIVLRREVFDIDVYKHKSFRFFEQETKQLDSGEVDMETIESVAIDG